MATVRLNVEPLCLRTSHGTSRDATQVLNLQALEAEACCPGTTLAAVINAGGPVRALQWCPCTLVEQKQHLAVATGHTAGERSQDDDSCPLLQIWEFPANDNETCSPELVLVAALRGSDLGSLPAQEIMTLNWLPRGSCKPAVLAVSSDEGLIRIVNIELAGPGRRASKGAVMDLESITLAHLFVGLGSSQGVGLAAAWQRTDDGRVRLGVGCSDGCLLLWSSLEAIVDGNLAQSVGVQSSALEPAACFKADDAIIRSVVWLKGSVTGCQEVRRGNAAEDKALGLSDFASLECSSFILTAGHSNTIRVWDTRDQLVPLVEVEAGRGWIVDCKWIPSTRTALCMIDDGTLRSVEVGKLGTAYEKKEKARLRKEGNQGSLCVPGVWPRRLGIGAASTVWSLAIDEGRPGGSCVLAAATNEGTLGITHAIDARVLGWTKMTFRVVAALRAETGNLGSPSSQDHNVSQYRLRIDEKDTLEAMGVSKEGSCGELESLQEFLRHDGTSPFPSKNQALLHADWSPESLGTESPHKLLAFGGTAGLAFVARM
eukprot:scaffold323_cov414-Prasinococcus_capsulatus_cf.AAC.35